jgi:hypothetical protein
MEIFPGHSSLADSDPNVDDDRHDGMSLNMVEHWSGFRNS